jgi:hypothetical protein
VLTPPVRSCEPRKPDATEIIAEDLAAARIFAQTAFNGDGIIVVESAPDDATQTLIGDIIACAGAEPDRSGKPGINQAKVDAFFAECTAFDDWHKKAEVDAATVLPLKDSTSSAVAAFQAVKAKVDDFFGRCRLAADPRAGSLNHGEGVSRAGGQGPDHHRGRVAGYSRQSQRKGPPLKAVVNPPGPPAWLACNRQS